MAGKTLAGKANRPTAFHRGSKRYGPRLAALKIGDELILDGARASAIIFEKRRLGFQRAQVIRSAKQGTNSRGKETHCHTARFASGN
jgi:hypothetical protein